MFTIREVARKAGVSVATVSRVLNRNGYVSKEKEHKVLQVIQDLKFEPNSLARGLAGKRTGSIALVLPDITNPFFPELARSVEDVCQKHGFSVFLCNSDDNAYKEKSYIEALRKRKIDGIIMATMSLEQEYIEKLSASGIPLIILDRAHLKESCPVVRSNNFKGAQLAVRHLSEIGCKKIAHIYGPPEIITAKERLDGYEAAVKEFNWYSPSLMAPGNFQVSGGCQAARTLLSRHPDIDGIFAGNDMMAIGAIKGLLQNGVRIPQDIAVCGFDGIHLSTISEPELTTIVQPIYEMGALAAQLLIQTINGKPPETKVYELDVTLTVRKSSDREGRLPMGGDRAEQRLILSEQA